MAKRKKKKYVEDRITAPMKEDTRRARDRKAFQKKQKAPQRITDPATGTIRYQEQ